MNKKKHTTWDLHEIIFCIIMALTGVAVLTTALIGAYADDTTMTLCARLLPFEIAVGLVLGFLAMVLPLPSDDDWADWEQKEDDLA